MFGVFNDEGLLEGDFVSLEKALEARRARYSDDDHAYAAEICPDHEDQPRHDCETCNYDDEEEE